MAHNLKEIFYLHIQHPTTHLFTTMCNEMKLNDASTKLINYLHQHILIWNCCNISAYREQLNNKKFASFFSLHNLDVTNAITCSIVVVKISIPALSFSCLHFVLNNTTLSWFNHGDLHDDDDIESSRFQFQMNFWSSIMLFASRDNLHWIPRYSNNLWFRWHGKF